MSVLSFIGQNMMKNIGFLFILASILFMGCSKDNDTKVRLKAGELKQTIWKGTILFSGSNRIDKIGVSFVSENKGRYEVIESIGDGDPQVTSENFDYGIDERILFISPKESYLLQGNWLLTEKTKNQLVFKLNGESERALVMTLSKVN
jgi:hypothetical protein